MPIQQITGRCCARRGLSLVGATVLLTKSYNPTSSLRQKSLFWNNHHSYCHVYSTTTRRYWLGGSVAAILSTQFINHPTVTDCQSRKRAFPPAFVSSRYLHDDESQKNSHESHDPNTNHKSDSSRRKRPTDCPMCQKYGSGPCGPLFWTWWECTEDHPDDFTTVCQQHFLRFQECSEKHQLDDMTKEEYEDDEASNIAWDQFLTEELYPLRPWKAFPTPSWQPKLSRKSDNSQFAQVAVWDPYDEDSSHANQLSLLAVLILESSNDDATNNTTPPKVIAAAATNMLMLEEDESSEDESDNEQTGSWRTLMFPIPPNAHQDNVSVLAVYERINVPNSLIVYEQVLHL